MFFQEFFELSQCLVEILVNFICRDCGYVQFRCSLKQGFRISCGLNSHTEVTEITAVLTAEMSHFKKRGSGSAAFYRDPKVVMCIDIDDSDFFIIFCQSQVVSQSRFVAST